MSIVLSWLRIDLRRRWRSLFVLMLLVVLAAATVMTTLAGARRGASTLTRLSRQTLPATAMVLPNTPGFDWSKIKKLPEVASLTEFIVDEAVEFVGFDASAGFPPVDGAFGSTIEKPVVFAGRYLNPNRADEVVVTPKFVQRYHKGIGDTVELDLPTAKQLAEGDDSGKLLGPHLTVHIVGVVLSPWLLDAEGPGAPGSIQMSPGVVKRYPAETLGDQHNPADTNYVNALVRLRGGEADIPQLRRDLTALTGRSDIEISSLPEQYRDAQRQLTFEARCLLAFGLAVFVAGLFLVGQAIARYTAASADELQTMRALGMTPRQAVLTAAAGPVLTGVCAAILAFFAAYLASDWMPIGTASGVESSRGRALDWVVLGPGVVLVALLVAAAAVSGAWLALGAARRGRPVRRSAVARFVARSGLSVPVVIGTRFALESGRGRTAVPVRPALIGAVTGVLGVLAAFTFSHGVTDASNHPERFGQTFQLDGFEGFNSQDFGPTAKILKALQASPLVEGVDDARTAVATSSDGHASLSLYAYQEGPKQLSVVVSSGRMPSAPDEVILAPRTLAALHTHVGARVSLKAEKQAHTYLVTGSALVPAGPHNGYADGGWMTQAGYDSLFKGFKFHIILITLAPSARTAHAQAALAASVAKIDPTLKGVSFQVPDPPTAILELRQVRVLPGLLGAFLVVLAIGAVGHALATAVRRRSHDLAVLRALGMTQWQCRRVVITQATVLAVVGLLFGVPLGLAIGRSVWREVADYTPLQYVPPFALWAMVLIIPAALLIANALAAWPGQRAARLRVAQILRAE